MVKLDIIIAKPMIGATGPTGSSGTGPTGATGATGPTGPGVGMIWNRVVGTSVIAEINNGYISNNVSLVTVTLPSIAAVGSCVAVLDAGLGGKWKIAQNAGQVIHYLSNTSTPGITGYISTSSNYGAVLLRCVEANIKWVAETYIGPLVVI